MKHDVDTKDKGTKMVLGEKFICGRGCNSVSIETVIVMIQSLCCIMSVCYQSCYI